MAYEEESRDIIEKMFLGSIGCLVAFNFMFMIKVMVSDCIKKRRLKALLLRKNLAEKMRKEREMAIRARVLQFNN